MRIGVDLGGTKIEAVALSGDGKELLRHRVATPQGDYAGTLKAITGLVRLLEDKLGEQGSVGVGTPGAISPATGTMKNCNSTCLNSMPLDKDLERALGRPVRMANDADCFTLSEATDGAGADAAVVFGVILGTGVGGGVCAHGRLLQGPNAITGEWGHNPLPAPLDDERPGPRCYCGRHGCVETFLAGPSLARDHERRTGQKLDAQSIMERVRRRESQAVESWTRYVDRLARALSGVINILDPHVIVLGGGVSNIEEIYSEVPARWGRYVFSDEVRTRLLKARHGDSSGVRGAAWLWPQGQ